MPELLDIPEFQEISNPGVVTVDVSGLSTGGAGTFASPWTGWDAGLTTELAIFGGNCTALFPSGVYGYSVSPNFGRWPNVHFKGEHGTVLKYTGSGVCANFLCTTAGIQTGIITQFGIIFENFIIDGSGSGTVGIYLGSIHHSVFRNIGIRNVTQKGVHLEFCVLDVFDNVRVTSRVGDSDGLGESTTQPVNGFVSNIGAIGGAGATQTIQACTFINPVVEFATGDGASFNAMHQCTIIGGSFEHNGGRNLHMFGEQNVLINVDNEYPGDGLQTEFLIEGDYNRLINCYGIYKLRIGNQENGNTTKGTQVSGGIFGGIDIDITARDTRLDGPLYDLSVVPSGVFDGGVNTEYTSPPRSHADSTVEGWGIKTSHQSTFSADVIYPSSSFGPVCTAPDGGRWRLSVSNAGATVWTSVGLSEIEAQSDSFTDNAIGKQWKKGSMTLDVPSTTVTVAETGAQLSLTLPNSTAGNNFQGLFSNARTIIDTGFERVKLISKPTTGTASYQVRFSIGTGRRNCLLMRIEGSTLYFDQVSGGSGSTIASVAFTLATMEHWRFLRAGANITAQYSDDGSSWNDLGTSTGVPWGTADDFISVCIEAGSTGSATFDAPVIFDDYLRG